MASEKQCERALEAFEDQLGSLPNVVGMGIVPEDEADPDSSGLAVGVYVTRKLPKEELEPDELIPQRLEYRDRRGRHTVKVRVIEQGEVQLEGAGADVIGKEPL